MERAIDNLEREKFAKIELIMSFIANIKPKDCMVRMEDGKFSIYNESKPLILKFETLDELYATIEKGLMDAVKLKSTNQKKIKLYKDNFCFIASKGSYTIYNLTNGQGSCLYQNGDKYEGHIVSGERDGKGILYYSNGDRYEGIWEYNQRNGRGILDYANGMRYEGEWRDDESFGEGIFIDPNKNLVSYILKRDIIEITSSGLNCFLLDKNKNKILKEIRAEAKRPIFNLFFLTLESYKHSTSLQAINIMEKSSDFINYLKSKIESSSNLLEEIKNTKERLNNHFMGNKAFKEVYLKYLEAVNFYQHPADYADNLNINYLKHIKECENLNLDLDAEELKNKLAIKQHDLLNFSEKEEGIIKLMNIPGYNEVLQYIKNLYYEATYQNGEKFIEVLKNPEISANDFRIFFVNNNTSTENLEKIILEKVPSVHGVAYYFFSKEKNGITKLGYGGKLNKENYQADATNVIKLGLNQDRTANMFILNYEDIKNMKNDQELFDVINKYKESCAILFKNKDGQNITLQIGDLNKMHEKPSSSTSPKSSYKMVENSNQLSKNSNQHNFK